MSITNIAQFGHPIIEAEGEDVALTKAKDLGEKKGGGKVDQRSSLRWAKIAGERHRKEKERCPIAY